MDFFFLSPNLPCIYIFVNIGQINHHATMISVRLHHDRSLAGESGLIKITRYSDYPLSVADSWPWVPLGPGWLVIQQGR